MLQEGRHSIKVPGFFGDISFRMKYLRQRFFREYRPITYRVGADCIFKHKTKIHMSMKSLSKITWPEMQLCLVKFYQPPVVHGDFSVA